MITHGLLSERSYASSRNAYGQEVNFISPDSREGYLAEGLITITPGESTIIPQETTLTKADRKVKLSEVQSITTYTVRGGDSLGGIASMFEISSNTIRWQNDLSHEEVIQPGQSLVILPIDGISHTVVKGESLEGIAKKYKGEIEEIQNFNNIYVNSSLVVGEKIVIPGGEPVVKVKEKKIAVKVKKTSKKKVNTAGKKTNTVSARKYRDPLKGSGVLTQAFHGRWRAIDIGAPTGTAVYAAASGRVIVNNGKGWGGGYGHYIVLQHNDGSKTLYAHLSRNRVSLGETVSQGQRIGDVGNTGRSTGPHLHFEIRDGVDIPYRVWGR